MRIAAAFSSIEASWSSTNCTPFYNSTVQHSAQCNSGQWRAQHRARHRAQHSAHHRAQHSIVQRCTVMYNSSAQWRVCTLCRLNQAYPPQIVLLSIIPLLHWIFFIQSGKYPSPNLFYITAKSSLPPLQSRSFRKLWNKNLTEKWVVWFRKLWGQIIWHCKSWPGVVWLLWLNKRVCLALLLFLRVSGTIQLHEIDPIIPPLDIVSLYLNDFAALGLTSPFHYKW